MSEKIELMVVVDMQNDFVSGSLGGDMARAIVPNVAAAVDKFIAENGGEVDYIHGLDELEKFTAEGGVGVALPAIGKNDFFSLIASGGNLPRKTFSMGEGNEKRYYIEAKKIR